MFDHQSAMNPSRPLFQVKDVRFFMDHATPKRG